MSADFKRACVLIRRGDPVPVDLAARLIEAGYDVAQMERAYDTHLN